MTMPSDKRPIPRNQRMAAGFTLALMGKNATHEEAALEMMKGRIGAQDVAEAAGWMIAVALRMKAFQEAESVA